MINKRSWKGLRKKYPTLIFILKRYGLPLVLMSMLGLLLFLNTTSTEKKANKEKQASTLKHNSKTETDYLKDLPLPDLNNFHLLTYIRSVFRVSDSEIRLSLVKSFSNPLTLYYSFGSKSGKVELRCHLPQCPDSWSPPCEISGYIGLIKGLEATDTDAFISLYTAALNKTATIPITDVRPKSNTYPHTLGVCLQPVYLMTDYTLFIQFFEYWLSEGATKFYIYWESFTPEVQEILNFYIKTSKVDIEMVPWSQLPTENQNLKNIKLNPNAFWFRLEVFLSLFDCIHRARHSVKFIAQTDLDEMFFVKNKTLLQLLNIYDKKNPEMADLHFQSKRAYLSTNISSMANPKDFPFEAFQEFTVDKMAFKKPLYIKIIHRPERNFRVHIHRSTQNEFIKSGRKKTYKTVSVLSKEATVWHFRRIKDRYKTVETEKTTAFLNKSRSWDNAFKERLKKGKLDINKTWKNLGPSFGKELEQCRQKQQDTRRKNCHNLMTCEVEHTPKGMSWVRAENSWTVV